jgi:hypothetical protein
VGTERGSAVWKIEKSLFLAVNCLAIPRLSIHNLIPCTMQQLWHDWLILKDTIELNFLVM